MDAQSWTVIQFLDDQSVEAVPSTWVQGDICYWPNLARDKLYSVIKKCEPLNPCWATHHIKSFRNATYGNYMLARNKAKLAETTSDLNTDREDCNKTPKRKRIQKYLSSSDESFGEECSLLPSPPKMKLKQKDKNNVRNENTPDVNQRDSNLVNFKENENQNTEVVINDTPQESDVNSSANACKSCVGKEKSLTAIIQQGHLIRSLLIETLTEVKEIKKDIRKMTGGDQHQQITKSIFNHAQLAFPIKTDDDFEKFEDFLSNEEGMNQAALEISKLGGSNIYDLMKRGLQLMFDNDFALKYSWLGRKGKLKFNNTLTAKMLLRAGELGTNETKKNLEVAIQTWLRRASDRKGSLAKKF